MNIITEWQGIAPQFRKLHPENETTSLDEIIVPRELIIMKKTNNTDKNNNYINNKYG